jgi:hypothetical protein
MINGVNDKQYEKLIIVNEINVGQEIIIYIKISIVDVKLMIEPWVN